MSNITPFILPAFPGLSQHQRQAPRPPQINTTPIDQTPQKKPKQRRFGKEPPKHTRDDVKANLQHKIRMKIQHKNDFAPYYVPMSAPKQEWDIPSASSPFGGTFRYPFPVSPLNTKDASLMSPSQNFGLASAGLFSPGTLKTFFPDPLPALAKTTDTNESPKDRQVNEILSANVNIMNKQRDPVIDLFRPREQSLFYFPQTPVHSTNPAGEQWTFSWPQSPTRPNN